MRARSRTGWIVAAIILTVFCLLAVVGAAAAWIVLGPSDGGLRQGGVEETIEQSFEVGSTPLLRIETFSGRVAIRGSEDGSTRVIATKHARGQQRLSEIEIEFVRQEGSLDILTSRQHPTAGTWVDLEITAPWGSELRLQSGAGDIDVDGLAGPVDIEAGVSKVRVRTIEGDLEIEAGTGSVEVESVGGDVRIDAATGRVEVAQVGGNLSVTTGAGEISARDVSGSLRLGSGTGSIRYEGMVQGKCSFENGTGSITLTLPEDLGAEVDLGSGIGAITVDFPVEGTTRADEVRGTIGGGDGASLYARTGTGTIRLVRK